MRALVVGYGSAGKRHALDLGYMGIETITVDPVVEADYTYIGDALKDNWFNIAVVATPPAWHMVHTFRCLDHGMWVLCEKPLCGLDGIPMAQNLYMDERSHRVMVAYNYRYHPGLSNPHAVRSRTDPIDYDWEVRSVQKVTGVPEWGYLLDSISHALDILATHINFPLIIETAEFKETPRVQHWVITGTAGNQTWIIDDIHHFGDVERSVVFRTPYGEIPLGNSAVMFINMLQAFLEYMKNDVRPRSDVGQAIYIQELMREINDIAFHPF